MIKKGKETATVVIDGMNISVPSHLSREVLYPTAWAQCMIAENLVPNEREKSGFVLDLGTGCGILALVLYKRGCRHIVASDVNSCALESARINIEELNDVRDKICLVQSDMFESLPADTKYQLIVANPPTLPIGDSVLKYGGKGIDLAFFSGENGRDFIDQTIEAASRFLLPGGRLMFLHPSYHDLSLTRQTISSAGLVSGHSLKRKRMVFNDFASVLGQRYGYATEKILQSLVLLSKKGTDTFFEFSRQTNSYEYDLLIMEAILPDTSRPSSVPVDGP